MSGHLSDTIIRRFIEGDISETDAEQTAFHIDECPLCANRVLISDPLSPWLASVDDPSIDPRIRVEVLAAVADRDREAARPWVGITLLFMAAMLLFAAGQPAELLRSSLTLLISIGVGVGAVLRSFSLSPVFLSCLAFAALLLSVSAVRLLGLSRDAG